MRKVVLVLKMVVALATCVGVGGLLITDAKNCNKEWENVLRYEQEHNTKCLSSKRNSPGMKVYVFTDYSIIGCNAMLNYYND